MKHGFGKSCDLIGVLIIGFILLIVFWPLGLIFIIGGLIFCFSGAADKLRDFATGKKSDK